MSMWCPALPKQLIGPLPHASLTVNAKRHERMFQLQGRTLSRLVLTSLSAVATVLYSRSEQLSSYSHV